VTARASAGGVAGPLAFLAAWLLAGARKPDYSPVDDAISGLAAVGSSTRGVMTLGLLAFSVGTVLYISAARAVLPGSVWLPLLATSLATLGVVAFPLGRSSAGDDIHAVFAVAAYVTLAATPLLAARPLAACGRRRIAHLSVATGTGCALCLAATLLGTAPGLFQRVGLTLGHLWIAASAVWMLRRAGLARPQREAAV
jgi:hypothetical membrane protein